MKCLDLLRPHIAAIRARAPALDETATFPTEDMALLRELGLPATPLPRALGGEGAGTEPHAATTTFELLRALGQANPSLGRLFEAHVNAIRLAIRYGTPAQHQTLATDCEAGHFYGLWVTDAPGKPLTLDGTTLKGAKGPRLRRRPPRTRPRHRHRPRRNPHGPDHPHRPRTRRSAKPSPPRHARRRQRHHNARRHPAPARRHPRLPRRLPP